MLKEKKVEMKFLLKLMIFSVLILYGCTGNDNPGVNGKSKIEVTDSTKKKIAAKKKSIDDSQKIKYRYDNKGFLYIGFMFWFKRPFAMLSRHPYILGEVIHVGKKNEKGFYNVEMRVLEVIGENKNYNLRNLKGINLRNVHRYVKDINIGDPIVTSFIVYKDDYSLVIPGYSDTNCGLGYKIEFDENMAITETSAGFLDMLRRTASKEKKAGDYRIWAAVDPIGTAQILIMKLEIEEMNNNK